MQYLPRNPLLDTNNAIRHHIMKLKRNNLINKPMGLIQALIAAGLLATPMLHAQTLDPAQTEQRQREQQEQQRLEQLRQQQERARSQSPAPVQPNQVTGNATPTGPCFPINQVNWHRVHGVVPVPLSIRLSAYNGTHDVNCLHHWVMLVRFIGRVTKDLSLRSRALKVMTLISCATPAVKGLGSLGGRRGQRRKESWRFLFLPW